MSNKKDYYELLGLTKSSNKDDIKKSYRKLASKYHPDKLSDKTDSEIKDSEQMFKQIKEAYETLSDDNKRKQYDMFGHNDNQKYHSGGNPFDDIMNGFMGGQQRHQVINGTDIHINVTITLEESYYGCQKDVKYDKLISCHHCSGSGAKTKDDIKTCSNCNGHGVVNRQIHPGFVTREHCSVCHGKGKIPSIKCNYCHGKGNLKESIKKTVSIPKGMISTGMQEYGQGNSETGSNVAGSLIINVTVLPEKTFQRVNNDLIASILVDYKTMCLGGDVNIMVFKESFKLNIKQNTQSNTVFRLRGKGFEFTHNGHPIGDILCTIVCDIPKKLSNEQILLIKQL